MSYDVALTADTGAECPPDLEGTWRNCTSNVAAMWREAGVDFGKLDGKTGAECAPVLRSGVSAIVAAPDKYIAMNPRNGWGNAEGALDFLRHFAGLCEEHPKAILRVSR